MNFKGKRILITGATGLVGSHLVEKLMSIPDVRVIALSRNENKAKKVFTKHFTNENFTYIPHDISVPLNIIEELNEYIDIIIHAASPVDNVTISNEPLSVIFPNVLGTKNVLDFMLTQLNKTGKHGRLLICSSLVVYGNHSDGDITVTEEDSDVSKCVNDPKAPYFESKRMMETIAYAYINQYDLDVVVARPSHIYGPTLIQPNSAFYEFVNLANAGKNIVIKNKGLPKRDNIYISDVINGILTVIKKGKTGEAYNISTNNKLDSFISVNDIAEKIAIMVRSNKKKSSVSFINKEAKKTVLPGIIIDNSKLVSIGWKPVVDFDEGIEKTLDYYTK